MSGRGQAVLGALLLAAALAWTGGSVEPRPGAAGMLLAAAGLAAAARGARAGGYLVIAGRARRPELAAAAAALRRGVLRGPDALPSRALELQAGLEGAAAVLLALACGAAGLLGLSGAGPAGAAGAVAALLVAGAAAESEGRGPLLRGLAAFAGRFPGHLPPEVPRRLEARLRDVAGPRALRLAAVAALTALAWGLEVFAALRCFEAFGLAAGPGVAAAAVAAVPVLVHAGAAVLPAVAGLGLVEIAAAPWLGGAGAPIAFLSFHGLAALFTLGVGAAARALAPGAHPAGAAPATRLAPRAEARARARARGERAWRFARADAARAPNPWLSVVIPAYNEERRIVSTLLATLFYLREAPVSFEIVVVDDGSRDDTRRVVEDLGARYPELRLTSLPHNRGKGAAVRAGVRAARGAWILLADADGATPIPELERLLAAAADGAEVAVGSRALAAPDVRVERLLGRAVTGRVFAFAVNAAAVPGIADTQCGFKLLRRDAALWIFDRQRLDGFAFDVELLFLARRAGLRAVEVPVNWINVEGSKVNALSDGLRMLADVLRLRRLHRGTDLDLRRKRE